MIRDLQYQRFGRLAVICITKKRIGKKVVWLCRCDCGNLVEIIGNSLLRGKTKSCGCFRKENKPRFKHGATVNRKKIRLYRIWLSVKGRCLNLNKADYKWYGKRGIAVCDEWKNNYENFRGWALSNGYADNLTIDRIDNNGDYTPGNCQWISKSENSKKSQKERRRKIKNVLD